MDDGDPWLLGLPGRDSRFLMIPIQITSFKTQNSRLFKVLILFTWAWRLKILEDPHPDHKFQDSKLKILKGSYPGHMGLETQDS
jgi:hypothetical protein